jgi:redox-sensitive bicupin YhaK (pirin superfamily)
VLEDGGVLEGLQIFIRPEAAGFPPQVQFYQLPEIYSNNRWRKIAGKGNDYPLQIRSNTWLMDLRLETGAEILLPEAPFENSAFLFYVFNGNVNVDKNLALVTGESVLVEMENPVFRAVETTDIVLLVTQTNTVYFDGGMYSGNLHS